MNVCGLTREITVYKWCLQKYLIWYCNYVVKWFTVVQIQHYLVKIRT